jgi:hypothetical protein
MCCHTELQIIQITNTMQQMMCSHLEWHPHMYCTTDIATAHQHEAVSKSQQQRLLHAVLHTLLSQLAVSP